MVIFRVKEESRGVISQKGELELKAGEAEKLRAQLFEENTLLKKDIEKLQEACKSKETEIGKLNEEKKNRGDKPGAFILRSTLILIKLTSKDRQ